MCRIPIFLAADNNYAPFVATTIASVCDNTKSFCNFYILDSGITDENKKKIETLKTQFNNFEIEYLEIDTDKYFSCIQYKNAPHISISTYNRFLIPTLKPKIEKAIYLDLDIIVLIDIKDLFNTDMADYAIAARPLNWFSNESLIYMKKYFGLSEQYKYFNAGILLLNNELWNKNKIFKDLLEIEAKYRKYLTCADQDVLNIYCNYNGGYKYLDDIYNIPPIHQNYKGNAILHFLNKDKPWHFAPDITEKDNMPQTHRIHDFWRYAQMTPFYDGIQQRVKYKTAKDLLKFRVQAIVSEKYTKYNKQTGVLVNV